MSVLPNDVLGGRSSFEFRDRVKNGALSIVWDRVSLLFQFISELDRLLGAVICFELDKGTYWSLELGDFVIVLHPFINFLLAFSSLFPFQVFDCLTPLLQLLDELVVGICKIDVKNSDTSLLEFWSKQGLQPV